MLEKFASGWWKFALQGSFAIVFGIVALIKPDQTLQVLVLAFGAFALMDGTLAVNAGISMAPFYNRLWVVLSEGILGIIIGLVTFFSPIITAVSLYCFIGGWAVITGILFIVTAIEFRKEITDEWTLVVGGLFSFKKPGKQDCLAQNKGYRYTPVKNGPEAAMRRNYYLLDWDCSIIRIGRSK